MFRQSIHVFAKILAVIGTTLIKNYVFMKRNITFVAMYMHIFINIYLANRIIQQLDHKSLNKDAVMLSIKPISMDKINMSEQFYEWKPDTST